MKHVAALLLMSTLTTAWAADPVALPGSPAASVAPLTAVPAARAASATAPSSPAVQAAQEANSPGKVRPENAVVPQLSVTLPGAATNDAARIPPPLGLANGKRDERAAACVAHITKADREKCERSL